MANDWLLDEPSPSEVTNASFQMVRRGYDPVEVQAFARAVGAELQRLSAENTSLRTQLAESERRASTEIDENTVTEFLGEETTRLLQAARDTAAGVVLRAEEKASVVVDKANDEAEKLRTAARSDAGAERREARDEARRLLADANSTRDTTLAELARRRDLACSQLDEMLNGRDVLVQTLADVASVAGELIGRLDAISADPSDFVNLDPNAPAGSELPVDPNAVLAVRAGEVGTTGARGKANGPKGNVDVSRSDDPVIVLEDAATNGH